MFRKRLGWGGWVQFKTQKTRLHKITVEKTEHIKGLMQVQGENGVVGDAQVLFSGVVTLS